MVEAIYHLHVFPRTGTDKQGAFDVQGTAGDIQERPDHLFFAVMIAQVRRTFLKIPEAVLPARDGGDLPAHGGILGERAVILIVAVEGRGAGSVEAPGFIFPPQMLQAT